MNSGYLSFIGLEGRTTDTHIINQTWGDPMKKLILLSLSIVGMLVVSAFAAETGAPRVFNFSTVSNAFVKKDDAYWTKVWYQKQAKKGKTYKKHVTKRSSRKSNSYSSGRVLAKVDLSSQTMKVYKGGRLVHKWPVSTGRSGYGTPTGTWKIHRMHKRYYSKKYNNAPMPYAMFYYRGYAVHGTNSISRLGRPASHGCVRLHPDNAAKLFSMVKSNGGVVKVIR
jgi:lipoprotein-anchoring transpeptidase ErfK/SrfK